MTKDKLMGMQRPRQSFEERGGVIKTKMGTHCYCSCCCCVFMTSIAFPLALPISVSINLNKLQKAESDPGPEIDRSSLF